MLDELAPQQWDEWEAFALLEPFGPLPEARQRASLVTTIAAANNGTLDPDAILQSWGFTPDEPPPDYAANEAAQIAGFTGAASGHSQQHTDAELLATWNRHTSKHGPQIDTCPGRVDSVTT